MLGRRFNRSARTQGTDWAEGREAIEDITTRFERAGLLAGAYASARAVSHYRSGASARAIRAKLNEKGVPPGVIEAATETLAYTGANLEFAAAAAYVRRRQLGLYRREGECRILTQWRWPDSDMSCGSASSMRRSPMSWSWSGWETRVPVKLITTIVASSLAGHRQAFQTARRLS